MQKINFHTSTIDDCKIVQLPKIHNPAGNITVVTNNEQICFEIKRVFYIYDIPGGESRGAHAHKECHQFLIAASGSFEVEMDDGKNKKNIFLNRPFYALHIPPGIWAHELNFSSGAICLVLTSDYYYENDYYRNYKQFKILKNGK